MKPIDPAPEAGHMHVRGHLPLSWRALNDAEAEVLKSSIMDRAVSRSWKIRPEGHVSVSEELAPVIRRLNEIDEKLDRVLKRLDRSALPEMPVRSLVLGTEECRLTPLEGETIPPAGRLVELTFRLLPDDDEDMLVLARSDGQGLFRFEFLAQDQIDHLVRYLLNRSRMAQ